MDIPYLFLWPFSALGAIATQDLFVESQELFAESPKLFIETQELLLHYTDTDLLESFAHSQPKQTTI